jgi:ADP-ribose pyrophosphatase YjhB (NUDIX family)
MEIDETVGQGAARESMEEANAHLELHDLYTVISVPQANQVHMFYRARLLDLDFSPGEESLETSLFTEEDIPWEDIAFRTVALTLRHFFADRRAGRFCFHAGEILPQD